VKTNPNTYFIILDALRSDHLKYMPWLSSKTDEGIFAKNLVISSGFCERAEIFLSLRPQETGFLNAINFSSIDSNKKPFHWFSKWPKFTLSFLEKNKFLQKIIRRLLWKISQKKSDYGMYPQRIPLEILDKIVLTEDAINFEEYAKKNQFGLLFEYLKKGYKINWRYFTSLSQQTFGNDSSRLNHLLKNVKKINNSFVPVYISTPDYFGHKYGPNSEELISALEKIDYEIKSFYKTIMKEDKKATLCLIGDHGMEKVVDSLNAMKLINNISKDINIKPQNDFYYFLDSTMLRLWNNSLDNYTWKKFERILKSDEQLSKKGYFINKNNCKNEGIPESAEIADIVWWAKKGVQVTPDFFHNNISPKAGMHGYLKKDNISKGFFLMLNNKNIIKFYDELDVINLKDILR
tara:strand:- start:4104 stop:5321 length:1218 start_codon:yes stop_codon:yes gene_type:complete